jgi:protein LSM14
VFYLCVSGVSVTLLSKVNGEEKKEQVDSGNETGAGEGEAEEDSEIFYDKAKSFFDNISCEAIERSKG